MTIQIDSQSGFCFGVIYAIQMAEDELQQSGHLYCLGDIVHNDREVERLQNKGLEIINYEQFKTLKNCKVLIRAHGEPPETYKLAQQNNVSLIDASCPVVLKLQNRIRKDFEEKDGQIVVYGKKGHAEVNGLVGQTGGRAIVVNELSDLDKINFLEPIQFFSQTTQSTKGYQAISQAIKQRMKAAVHSNGDIAFEANDTLCRQVSNREPHLSAFAKQKSIVLFVSGRKSANGKSLFDVCKRANPKTYFIAGVEEIKWDWFNSNDQVGICGATSTPMWLMEDVKKAIEQHFTTT